MWPVGLPRHRHPANTRWPRSATHWPRRNSQTFGRSSARPPVPPAPVRTTPCPWSRRIRALTTWPISRWTPRAKPCRRQRSSLAPWRHRQRVRRRRRVAAIRRRSAAVSIGGIPRQASVRSGRHAYSGCNARRPPSTRAACRAAVGVAPSPHSVPIRRTIARGAPLDGIPCHRIARRVAVVEIRERIYRRIDPTSGMVVQGGIHSAGRAVRQPDRRDRRTRIAAAPPGIQVPVLGHKRRPPSSRTSGRPFGGSPPPRRYWSPGDSAGSRPPRRWYAAGTSGDRARRATTSVGECWYLTLVTISIWLYSIIHLYFQLSWQTRFVGADNWRHHRHHDRGNNQYIFRLQHPDRWALWFLKFSHPIGTANRTASFSGSLRYPLKAWKVESF